MPNLTREGDIHVSGSMKTAWFRDPDGNIFSLVTPPARPAEDTVVAATTSRASR